MRQWTRVNLHCHSDLSDGAYPPETVAEFLARDNVRFAALADHDTLAGQQRFKAALAAKGIGFVAAVEITARYRHQELHLLAYGFDLDDPTLATALDETRRRQRVGLATMLNSIRGTVRNMYPEDADAKADRKSVV